MTLDKQAVSDLVRPLFEEGIVDGHAHPCRNADINEHDISFAFAETDNAEQLALHAPSSLTHRAGLRYLADVFQVEPTLSALATHRNHVGLSDYGRRLCHVENIQALLLDSGYPSDGMGIEAMSQSFQVDCFELIRIESLAESLLQDADSAVQLLERFEERLREATRDRVVGYKTIAAYRGGLQLGPPAAEQAEQGFQRDRQHFIESGAVRIESSELIAALVATALRVGAELKRPLQIHSGFGDADLTLSQSNPWLMKPWLEDRRFGESRFVFLHAAYPFVREAAILTALYPHVYVDVSLAIPLSAHGADNVFLNLLEQAPTTKLLYGSDASSTPELFGWAAYVAKRSWIDCLTKLLTNDWLMPVEASEITRQLFRENARRLYSLP